MSNSEPKLPLHGSNVAITVFVGKQPLTETDNITSLNIDENNNQHVRKLLGQTGDKLDETPGHWEITLDKEYASSAMVSAFLAQKAARAANQPFDEISIGMVWTNRDGSQTAWIANKCTTKLGLKIGGKDEAIMQNNKFQCETLVPQEL